MENTKNKLFTSYEEYIKEMKSSLDESIEIPELDQTIESPFENDVRTETIETSQELEVIEPTDFEPLKENHVVLTLQEFIKNK